jgi:hypothetical protein
MKNFVIFLGFLLFSCWISGNILEVNLDGTGDYDSVTAAMDACIAGDTLLVYPGIYYENIHLYKDITMMSLFGISGEETYIDSTILDGNSITTVIATENYNVEFFSVNITGFTIRNGFARSMFDEHAHGGGIYACGIEISVHFCKIKDNRAFWCGGIFLGGCTAYFSGCEISGNISYTTYAGGLYISNGTTYFDETNKNSIFLNYGGKTNDISYVTDSGNILDINLNVFTVSQYNSYFIKSFQDPYVEDPQFINLNVDDHLIDPISEDLYISPDGDNENSGLSANDPLQSVSYALALYDDSSPETHTLHLSDGYYGSSNNNEKLPWHLHSNLVIEGESEENTIISTEGYTGHIVCRESLSNVSISNMTLTGGNMYPSIWIFYIDGLILENITIRELSWIGNVINLAMCNAEFRNLTIHDVVCSCPIALTHYSSQYMLLENVDVSGVYQHDNDIVPADNSCGIVTMSDTALEYARFDLINCKFVDIYTYNSTYPVLCGTGCDFSIFSDVNMINCLVANTRTNDETDPAVYVMDSRLNLVNSIIFDVDNRALCRDYYDMMLPEITVDHSLVQGGEAGVGGAWGDLNWLEGNIDCDPMFDMSLPNRYSLLEGSPCIDAGTLDLPEGIELPEYDLAGNPRISGDMIDMGPYEWQYYNANDDNELPSADTEIIVYPNPLFARELRDGMAKIIWCGDNIDGEMSFEIFNVKGQCIAELRIKDEGLSIGSVSWDLYDDVGKPVSSGVYFVRVKTGDGYVAQRKMTVIK